MFPDATGGDILLQASLFYRTALNPCIYVHKPKAPGRPAGMTHRLSHTSWISLTHNSLSAPVSMSPMYFAEVLCVLCVLSALSELSLCCILTFLCPRGAGRSLPPSRCPCHCPQIINFTVFVVCSSETWLMANDHPFLGYTGPCTSCSKGSFK